MAQNCLKRIMSQLLEYTKKIDKKSREKKIEKLFLGQNFLTPKMTKESRKIIFGSELFEPHNEPNFRLYQKN